MTSFTSKMLLFFQIMALKYNHPNGARPVLDSLKYCNVQLMEPTPQVGDNDHTFTVLFINS